MQALVALAALNKLPTEALISVFARLRPHNFHITTALYQRTYCHEFPFRRLDLVLTYLIERKLWYFYCLEALVWLQNLA